MVADLFSWAPPATYDAVLFGFWISHVPADRWEAFWSGVRRCLRPGGSFWFCHNADPDLATIDPTTRITERALPDGRSFRVVKRFYEPDDLALQLASFGFDATVTTTEWAFLLGRGVVPS